MMTPPRPTRQVVPRPTHEVVRRHQGVAGPGRRPSPRPPLSLRPYSPMSPAGSGEDPQPLAQAGHTRRRHRPAAASTPTEPRPDRRSGFQLRVALRAGEVRTLDRPDSPASTVLSPVTPRSAPTASAIQTQRLVSTCLDRGGVSDLESLITLSTVPSAMCILTAIRGLKARIVDARINFFRTPYLA